MKLRVLAMVSLSIVSGCSGPSGPTTYRVSGEVTFQGKPVPAGTIVFEPLDPAAVQGLTSIDIASGKYDSGDKAGAAAGKCRVTITGADRVAANEDEKVTVLFPPYVTEVDLPAAVSTQNFEVPLPAKPSRPGPVVP